MRKSNERFFDSLELLRGCAKDPLYKVIVASTLVEGSSSWLIGATRLNKENGARQKSHGKMRSCTRTNIVLRSIYVTGIKEL